MIVRELLTRLGFAVNGAQFNKAEQATQRIKQQANEAANAVRGIVAGFIGLQGIQALIATGDQVQSLQARIGMLPQAIEPASVEFNKVADAAIDARSSLLAYGTLYTRIGNAAKDYLKTSDEIAGVTTTISKALIVGGATTQEAQSTMIQFAQALGSGTLQGEEFRAMAEAAPQYMDKLAEALGHPRAALKKLASDGKITSKDVIKATQKMKEHFDQQMMKMPMTVGQATTIISSRWAKMINRLNNESSFITRIANSMLNKMEMIEGGIDRLEKKFGGFNNILRFIGVTLGVIVGGKLVQFLAATRGVSLALVALGSGNVIRALTILRTTLLMALLPVIKIVAAVALLAFAVDDFLVYLDGGSSVIGDFVQWLKAGSAAAELLKTAVTVLGGVVATFAIVKIGALIASLGMAALIFAATAFAALGAGLKIAAGIFIAIWPIGLLVVALVGVVAAFYYVVQNWEKITGIFQSLMQKSAEAILGFWQPVRDWFADFFGWFGDKYEAIKGFVAPAFGGAQSIGGVSPGSLAPSAIGQGRNIQNNTSVTVTVPPGTTAEQASFLQAAAAKTFGDASDAKFARQISVYAP